MPPAPAPRPGTSADIVDTARGGGRAVSLTFDDGPNPADTLRLLDVLRRHRIAAVFCLWGEHVDAYPDVVRRIVADGHTLGNHSMRHENMSSWPPERIEADLREADAAIRRAAPGARVPYFRAPYGAWGQTPAVATALGMQPLGWRLALGDWDPPGADELVRRLRYGVTPGAVVLMHDGGGDRSQTVDAVERVVPLLTAEHWRFTLPRHRA
ncbi:cellulose-binding protein [Micromonospora sp. ATCC 39149]|uniref:Polysaccharide deacetylase family protein n=1 Tax=Micromonospora carbonacea TaxID=47853 RepID=A0A7D5Y6L4_9ACTN|nr:polysaccharide deacetylase family protein [Micromonospora sp. ATCC 39149]EEP70310.1 cellulose-binding protein [Micromonospora sp. ATCC 39149]QLJ96721.1 polysaccharide deacetylase family protein [Micromonospora carbonacea]